MKKIFIDTGGWMSMADQAAPAHQASISIRDRYLEQDYIFVTSDYVIDETLTLIRMRLGIDAAEKWWNHIERSPRLRFETVFVERLEKARTWFFKWRDKPFSFTDCTSFVIMKELGIKEALTVDKHFLEAEFEILPTI